MTLEESISSIIAKKLEDGTVEDIIEKKLISAIESVIGDIFRWGSAEKAIKEKLEAVMVPAIEGHDFSEYTLKVDHMLTNIIEQTSLMDNKKILESFKELMIEPDLKEIKLSAIFDAYKEYVAENVDTDGLEACCDDSNPYYESVEVNIDVEIEKKKYFTSCFDNAKVTFTCEHDKGEKLEYNLQLFRDKGKEKENWSILNIGIDQAVNMNSLKHLSKFEILLIKLKRAYANVELDIECDTDEVTPKAEPEWSLQ